MPEGCALSLGQECSNGTKLALLERRIGALEEGQDREENFRKTYYADRDARNIRDARLDMKLKSIDENVSKLVKRQEEEDEKPRRLWNGLVDKIIVLMVSAVIGYFLAKAGL